MFSCLSVNNYRLFFCLHSSFCFNSLVFLFSFFFLSFVCFIHSLRISFVYLHFINLEFFSSLMYLSFFFLFFCGFFIFVISSSCFHSVLLYNYYLTLSKPVSLLLSSFYVVDILNLLSILSLRQPLFSYLSVYRAQLLRITLPFVFFSCLVGLSLFILTYIQNTFRIFLFLFGLLLSVIPLPHLLCYSTSHYKPSPVIRPFI